MDDLVWRNDLYFEKFTNTPFTGEVSGKDSGKFKKGQKNGEWLSYFNNGQLWSKGNYKAGKEEGLWKFYSKGQLWVGTNYKDGQQDGLYEHYYDNGKLRSTGNYKNNKQEGLWEDFNEKGGLKERRTYKDGVLVE